MAGAMSDHELADGRLRARIELLSHADLVRFAMFSITATRQGRDADALKSFADKLIVGHMPLAYHDLLASVLASPDLLSKIIAHLGTRDGGAHAALTCKTWRSAWNAVVAMRKALGRAQWYCGPPPFGFTTAQPTEGHYAPHAPDIWVPAFAMASKDSILYVFGEQIAALHVDNLRLDASHSHARYFPAPPGDVAVSEAYSDGVFAASTDQTIVVDVVMVDSAVYVLTNRSLLKFDGSELSSMTLAAELTSADMRKASSTTDELYSTEPGSFGCEQIAFSLAWSGDTLFLLLRFVDRVQSSDARPNNHARHATVVSVDSELLEAHEVPLPGSIDLPLKLAATGTTLILGASAKRRTQNDLFPLGVGAELYVLTHQGGVLRRIRIDEPNEVMLSLGMSSCEQYFVLGTWPYTERGQPHAMPKLRLFTQDGVCCSTLTIARRFFYVHYMLVTADAVHIGHGMKLQGEGILRVPLEAGLSNAERKSLRGLQDLDLELTSFEILEEEQEEEGYDSDEEGEEQGSDDDDDDDDDDDEVYEDDTEVEEY